ncbi:unnamed protein product [Caenorhabditis sp. 36 PRJEB53466]|nr:unnamed protein product [Caenorhabditis sp. 36 PRJEB53466]
MVSARGEKKENKKTKSSAQSPQKSARSEAPKLPSADEKQALSPKGKPPRKKPSKMQVSVDASEVAPTENQTETVEATLNEDENASTLNPLKVSSSSSKMLQTGAVSQMTTVVELPKPPPTHFAPFVVKLEPEYSATKTFFANVSLNRNMIVTTVRRPMMPLLIAGDLMSAVNGVSVWNRRQLDREINNCKKTESAENPVQLTVIRVWNMICPPRERMELLNVQLDERLQHFMTRVYLNGKSPGFNINQDKRRVYVMSLKPKSPVSYSLRLGDYLLAIGDTNLNFKTRKTTQTTIRNVLDRNRKIGYVDVIACRPVLYRSSPNPSLEADLTERFPELLLKQEKESSKPAAQPPTGPPQPPGTAPSTAPAPAAKTEKKEPEDLKDAPLEADSLEIALREMCCLQQFVKPETPLPSFDKGRSLLRAPSTLSAATSSATNLAEKSVYMPTTSTAAVATASTMGPSPAGTPRKKKWKSKSPSRQATISFKEQPETAKITSDVSDEAELKKCDPRSGIVAYIRNVFNSN